MERLIRQFLDKLPRDYLRQVQDKKGVNIPLIDFEAPGNETKKSVMLVREIGEALADQCKYFRAASIFETTSEYTEEYSLSTNLSMAECYLSLGREKKAMGSMKIVREFLLSDQTPCPLQVYDMVQCLVEAKLHVRALILLPVAVELYKRLPDPRKSLNGMFRCIKLINECTCHLINGKERSQVLGIDFGLDLMEKSLKDMLKIPHFERSLAVKHCHVAVWMGHIHSVLSENEKGISVRQKGIEHMFRVLGMGAKKYRIYASSYFDMGMDHVALGESDDAKNAYRIAIDAAGDAIDFIDEEARSTEIQKYRKKLNELH